MSKKYSSKFVNFVHDVLFKYDGYVYKPADKNGKIMIKYDPGFGSQFASVPVDLYNTLTKKSSNKKLTIDKKKKEPEVDYEATIKKYKIKKKSQTEKPK
jgi:hypothetical protein